MKRIIAFTILVFIGLSLKAQSLPDPLPSPVQSGSYFPGIISPRDYTNPGTSGLEAIDYNTFFNSNKFIDKHGDEDNSIDIIPGTSIPIDTDISGYINTLAVTYVSPEIPALGNARYMGTLSPSYSTSTFKATLKELPNGDQSLSGTVGGMGDLIISPVYLT